MEEGFWGLLEKFSPDAHQAALKVCAENDFDQDSWDVSLNESYLNLLDCCNVLRGAVKEGYFQKMPLTIQKELEGLVVKIVEAHDELLVGRNMAVELAKMIESLYTAIWRYRLNQLSSEDVGYANKLDQLKQIELSVSANQVLIATALASKEKLDQLLSDFAKTEEAIQEKFKVVTDISEKCESKLGEIEKNGERADEAVDSINQVKVISEADSEAIHSRTIQASSDQQEINLMVAEFRSLTNQLAEDKRKQQDIFSEFESFRKKIDGLLVDANRTGLAASFTSRRLWLRAPLAGWLFVFAFSIYGLWSIGREHIVPILDGNQPILWEQLPLRLILTAPLVWLGWFSARQYGFTSRLREDYAYKEASSMSFEGFKREAKEIDEEMLKKLLEQAIKNLGDNPIRIYDGKNNHQTPTQELIENLLSNEKFRKLVLEKFEK